MSARTAEAVQHSLFEEDKTSHHGPIDPSDPLHWIHFGTSTWAYPGWKGIVYSKVHKNTTDYLREYVEYPSFRTAGADFTFYRPPDPRDLCLRLLRSGYRMAVCSGAAQPLRHEMCIDSSDAGVRRQALLRYARSTRASDSREAGHRGLGPLVRARRAPILPAHHAGDVGRR